jgi:hypothetical protein
MVPITARDCGFAVKRLKQKSATQCPILGICDRAWYICASRLQRFILFEATWLNQESTTYIDPKFSAYPNSPARRTLTISSSDGSTHWMNAGWISTGSIPARPRAIRGCSDRDHVIHIRAVAQFHNREGLRDARQVALVFRIDHALFGLAQVRKDGANAYLYGDGRIAQVSATDAQYFLGGVKGFDGVCQ